MPVYKSIHQKTIKIYTNPTSTRWSATSLGIFSTNNSTTLRISCLALINTEFCIWECCDCVVCCMALNLATSFAMVIMNAGGRAVAMSDKACLDVLQASAAGDRGNPKVMLKESNQLFYMHSTMTCICCDNILPNVHTNKLMP